MATPESTLVVSQTEQSPSLGDIVTRGAHGSTEYRIWLIQGDIAIATSQATGVPHRVPLSSLRFVRHVPGGLFGARMAGLTDESRTQTDANPPQPGYDA